MTTHFWKVGLMTVLLALPSVAQDPCEGRHARALVLGGGGSKGAFQAGAAYHLIVHRGCDFAEFSGTSVGALNGAVLAQAPRSPDGERSLANAKAQAETLISMWRSIKSSKDVVKGRRFGALRFALFGLESTKSFAPLRKLMARNIDPERLREGRELRVGTVSLHDGQYREFVLNENGRSTPYTLELLLASTSIPMFAVLPRIAMEEGGERVQFGDGGLRHNSPVRSYFVQCAAGKSASDCRKEGNHSIPPHRAVEQLFVITTNPYEPDTESNRVWDTAVFKRGTHEIADGRKVVARAISVIMDAAYHQDLDAVLLENELLKWRESAYRQSEADSLLDAFPLESYNYDPAKPSAGSRAYSIGIVLPSVGDAGTEEILSFSCERIAKQMYCGCIAADEMMKSQFGLDSMSSQCRERFHFSDENTTADCRSRIIEPAWHAALSADQLGVPK